MSDPFDFSDFGSAGARVAAAPGGFAATNFGGQRAESSGPLPHNGFDPFGGVAPKPQQVGKPFAGAASLHGGIDVAKPPLAFFAVALFLAAAGMAISAFWGQALAAAALGWLLAGPIAIGVLSTYSRIDTRRRTEAVYSAPAWVGAMYWVVVSVCLAGIGLGSWHLALWAGGQ